MAQIFSMNLLIDPEHASKYVMPETVPYAQQICKYQLESQGLELIGDVSEIEFIEKQVKRTVSEPLLVELRAIVRKRGEK